MHIAQRSDSGEQPLDAFTQDFDDWQNRWTGNYHSARVWNKRWVFTLIEIPRRKNRWLFGGVFEVLDCKAGFNRQRRPGYIYTVKKATIGEGLIGRLIVDWQKDQRSKHRVPLNHGLLDSMSVAEIIPKAYQGEDFPGHANINHGHAVLANIWREGKPDWRSALEHCHGVYLITDVKTGLRYVGSAYGDEGIWSRWSTYLRGGHGGNRQLRSLIIAKGPEYAKKHFVYSLLEVSSSRDSNQRVIERESYWKDVLLTRGKYGLNDN